MSPYSYFTNEQLTPLLIAGLLLVISIIVFNKRSHLGLLLLVIGTGILGYFVASLDPFLVTWDEQYHALVAKNLSNNPFVPVLYPDPILGYDQFNWTGNYIWLHKQPLFLWQMALSIKLFGTNIVAVRLPSILLHAILPLFIFRIGSIIRNKEVGFYSALLFAVACFPLELMAGKYTTDHNDLAFLFYVTASFWAWFEYYRTKNWRWLILIGVFSGGAVLVKWLMGLLVFVVWMITVTLSKLPKFPTLKDFLPLVISGGIALITFLPWQVYISLRFPAEASYEYGLNKSHFFEAVEEHTGDLFFHFTDAVAKIYGTGDLIPIILLLLIVLLIKSITDNVQRVFIVVALLFVYLFYSIAATKMVAFTVIVAPFIYLAIGNAFVALFGWFKKMTSQRRVLLFTEVLTILVISYMVLDINQIQSNHTAWNENDKSREAEQRELALIDRIKTNYPEQDFVLFNTNQTVGGSIPFMFFTNNIAYEFVPTEQQIKTVLEKGRSIAILNTGDLPDRILLDERIIKIKAD